MAELDRRAYAAAYGPTTGDRVRLTQACGSR
jgi:urease alpha subunit